MNTHTDIRLTKSAARRRGGALVLSLIAVVVVAILAASFLSLASAITRRGDQAADQCRSFYLAEAGLGEAYSGIMFGKSGNVGSIEEPAVFGEGLFWVEATYLGDDMRELRSTGMCGQATTTLSLVVQHGSVSVAALGVFSHEDLIVPEGVLVDAYDSSKGSYSGPPILRGRGNGPSSKKARVGSNGDLTIHGSLENPTEIYGDAVPGRDGHVVLVGEPLVTGSTDPCSHEIKLPKIEVPELDEEDGISQDNPIPLMIRSGEFGYEYLRVEPGSDLILSGPLTLVVDQLQVAPGGSLAFDTTDGEVRIYVLKELQLESGSLVSTSGEDTSMVSVFLPEDMKDDPALLGAEGAFHGVVYGPKAPITIDDPFELFGAVIAEQLELAPGTKLHFDQFLAMLADEHVMPSFMSWRLMSFESPVPGDLGHDPFRKLGLDPSDLPLPATAHEDQFLEIEYRNHNGDLQNYAGMESGFDWTDVDVIIGGWRDGKYAALTGSTGTVLVK